MDENIELLEYIYKNAEMGVFTMTELLKDLKEKENKIKPVVEKELKEYEKYLKQSKKYLKKYDAPLNKNGMMAKMMSGMGIKKETMTDNSDAAIAHMIIEGATMGIVDIESKVKNYKTTADSKILSLGKKFLKTLECQVEELKKYL